MNIKNKAGEAELHHAGYDLLFIIKIMENHWVLSRGDKNIKFPLKTNYHSAYNTENELEQSFLKNGQ